jgi:hypothetical protein
MLPYLAVIRDSFHAALSSRVLWVAFATIWLLLAALAPIGYREDYTTTFRWHDFHNGTRFKAMLAKGLVDPQAKQTAIGRVAAAMPEDLRRELTSVGEGDEVRIRLDALSDALNHCLDDERWYDAEAWKSTLRFRELRELDQAGDQELTESLRRRRARLRIEAAFPGVFQTRATRSVLVTYAGFEFPWDEIAVDKTQFAGVINHFVIPLIIDMVLGFAVLFLGILVTASIIPEMLQPGSLHLLLSKPISRTMLLLSKFVGGCAFVLLCVVQLVIGLYLIAGLRLDIWNPRLMWCIPVSVFLFAVYYSVSLVAGLRWRTPILAIGVTAIFWVICFVVSLIGGLFDEFVTRPAQIRELAVAGQTLLGGTRQGGLVRYDPGQNRWIEIIPGARADKVLAPVVLDDDTIATASVRGGRFNPFGSGAIDLLVLSRQDNWTPEPSLRLPTATSRLYGAGRDAVLALNTAELAITSRQSILAAAGQHSGSDQAGKPGSNPPAGGADWLTKLSNMMGGATEGFTSVLPERMALTPPRQIVVDPAGQWLVALSHGRLVRLERPAGGAGTWTIAAQHSLEGDASLRGVLGVSGGVLMVSRTSEAIQLFAASSLEPLGQVALPDSLLPVSVVGLRQRRFALLTGDGRCRVIAPDGGDAEPYSLSKPLGASEIESIHTDADRGKLYLVHHVDQLDVLDGDELSILQRIRPSVAGWRLAAKYVIAPLRTVIPPTGRLGETTRAMVSGESAFTLNQGEEEDEVFRYQIIGPVASCATFMVVMLTIGCVYFSTRDF